MKHIIKIILYKLGLFKSPIDRLISNIENTSGIKLSTMDGIELFARDGSWSTDAVAKKLKSIDFVEIDRNYESILMKKYPLSNIYIADAYIFIKNCNKKYDVVLSDNPASKHGGGYFQHFSLFPYIFDILKDKSLLILNVIDDYGLIHYNSNEYEEHEALKEFYKTNSIKIKVGDMLKTYKNLAEQNAFEIYNYIKISRGAVSYLCLFLRKKFV